MWKKLSSKQIFKHSRITLLEDEVRLPDGAVVPYLTFAHTNDSVTIIGVEDDRMLLSREYSYPIGEVLYQFAGGKIDLDEDPGKAAFRELQEETGYVAGKLQELGWYYPNNRRSKAKMYVFLATDLVLGEKQGGDLEEDISSEWLPIAELQRKIAAGDIVNFSVIAAWALYQTRKSSLRT